jgi:hypothetical protein
MDFTPIIGEAVIAGQRIPVTALPCGILRRLVMPLVKDVMDGNIMQGDNIQKVLFVCHQSVSKADPSISLESLEDGLMLADLAALFQEIIRISGMVRGSGNQAEGEATPQSFGGTSTGTSQPPPDGHSPTSTGT